MMNTVMLMAIAACLLVFACIWWFAPRGWFRPLVDSPVVALLRAENAKLRAEIGQLRANEGVTTFPKQAPGQLRGVHHMNVALWKMGAMQHEPPKFAFFQPHLESKAATVFKEIRLPLAKETHEVVYEPTTRCVFVSQMTNSVLVRIPVGADGLLIDDADAWLVGPVSAEGIGISGLHNLSLSKRHPGCLWVSLQFANQLLLIEAATMAIRKVILCPSLLKRADGTAAKVGGPHCIRECEVHGHIHVALKGSVPCHPGEELVTPGERTSLKKAITRACCDPKALRERLELLEEMGYGAGPTGKLLPEGWAVWTVDPEKYDSKAGEARGGQLFECLASPPMIAIDHDCNLWVPQDK